MFLLITWNCYCSSRIVQLSYRRSLRLWSVWSIIEQIAGELDQANFSPPQSQTQRGLKTSYLHSSTSYSEFLFWSETSLLRAMSSCTRTLFALTSTAPQWNNTKCWDVLAKISKSTFKESQSQSVVFLVGVWWVVGGVGRGQPPKNKMKFSKIKTAIFFLWEN